MKKLLLLTCSAAISISGFAQANLQRVADLSKTGFQAAPATAVAKHALTANKSTGVTDTTLYDYNHDLGEMFDSTTAYYFDRVSPRDSGFYIGTNAAGYKGAAETYLYPYHADTTLHVLGFVSSWFGSVQPTSTKTVNFKLYNLDTTRNLLSTHFYVIGLPGQVKASVTDSFRHMSNFMVTFLPAAITGVNYSFAAGYDINYTWSNMGGDTVSLGCTPHGTGIGNGQGYISGSDTLMINQNAVMLSNGTWKNIYSYIGLDVNLSIAAIVQFEGTGLSVQGVTKNNLTFFGNYPNPAVNSTNIKFALKNASDVTVSVIDLSGRTIRTVNESKMGAGEHTINLNTSDLAAGTYVYMVRTGEGDAMASKLTVIK